MQHSWTQYSGQLPAWMVAEVAQSYAEPTAKSDRPIKLFNQATILFELRDNQLIWSIDESNLAKLGVPEYRLGEGSRLMGENQVSGTELGFWQLQTALCD